MSAISFSAGYYANTAVASACGPGCDCASCQAKASLQTRAQTQLSNVGEKTSTSDALKVAGASAVEKIGLSKDERAKVESLKKSDSNVRRHEQAHLAAAGGLAQGGPSYQFVQGPDGVSYAVAGEVKIDVSPGRTPEETLRKARIIQAAALAPADPSGQDLSVAAQAKALELQAEAQIAQRSREEQKLASAYPSTEIASTTFSASA